MDLGRVGRDREALGARLRAAADRWASGLEDSGKKGPATLLAEEMTERLAGLGERQGTTYRSVLNYFSGQTTPSLEWLREAADLLAVRPAWLAYGDGYPTEEEQRAAEKGVANELAQRTVREVRQGLGLNKVMVSALHGKLPPWAGGILELYRGHRLLVRAENADADEEEIHAAAVAVIVEALKAPFETYRLTPSVLSIDDFTTYVFQVTPALLQIQRARQVAAETALQRRAEEVDHG